MAAPYSTSFYLKTTRVPAKCGTRTPARSSTPLPCARNGQQMAYTTGEKKKRASCGTCLRVRHATEREVGKRPPGRPNAARPYSVPIPQRCTVAPAYVCCVASSDTALMSCTVAPACVCCVASFDAVLMRHTISPGFY